MNELTKRCPRCRVKPESGATPGITVQGERQQVSPIFIHEYHRICWARYRRTTFRNALYVGDHETGNVGDKYQMITKNDEHVSPNRVSLSLDDYGTGTLR